MRQRCMSQLVRAATRSAMVSQHRGKTRKPMPKPSRGLKGEKSAMVVLLVEAPCYSMTGFSPQLGAKGMTQ